MDDENNLTPPNDTNNSKMLIDDAATTAAAASNPAMTSTKSLFTATQSEIRNDPRLQASLKARKGIDNQAIDWLFKKVMKELGVRATSTVTRNLTLKRSRDNDSDNLSPEADEQWQVPSKVIKNAAAKKSFQLYRPRDHSNKFSPLENISQEVNSCMILHQVSRMHHDQPHVARKNLAKPS